MDRRHGYNETGGRYAAGRYGSKARAAYHAMRCEALADILTAQYGANALRILEVGCGPGLTLDFLSQQGSAYQLVGSDFSITMVKQARELANGAATRTPFSLADARHLPFASDSLDVVYATRFIHQFDQQQKNQVFAEMSRVVRPGGSIVLEFYSRPLSWLRYYTGRKMGPAESQFRCWKQSSDSFFSHYPSVRNVQEVVGADFRRVPLRFAGARFVRRLFGETGLRQIVKLCARGPGRVLLDEYFVVATKPT